MISLDKQYWNNRYAQNNFGWDLGAISPPLKSYFDQLNNKELEILIPGAGNAYEVEYLFENGFKNVYLCDFARLPLENFKTRNPQFPQEQLLEVDFFELKEKKFDLIVEQTFFCAIDPSLRKAYFEKMKELLKEDGKLVGLLFNDSLNSDQPPFGGNEAEYRTLFKDLFTVLRFETCTNSVKPRADREIFMELKK